MLRSVAFEQRKAKSLEPDESRLICERLREAATIELAGALFFSNDKTSTAQ